ncbi:hypothetical protein B0J17DRAFT_455906 [Rhizoctonia solani]|nr:hypothetical protein B0J17DRAFT_455906 [Rhizoctonia solani]
MTMPRCGLIRNYAAKLLDHTSMLGELLKTPEVKDVFVRTLYELDFHELTGLVLLLLTRESFDELTEDEPDKLMYYIDSLDRIPQTLVTLPPYPDDLSESIFADWLKVDDQLSHYRFGSLLSGAPRDTCEAVMDVWGPLLSKKFIKRGRLMVTIYQCSYPRCADPMACGRHLEQNSVCRKCGKAWYCSRRCQQLHCVLRTVDSHSVC